MDEATQRLIDDLRGKAQSFGRDELLHAAQRFRFHDFKSRDALPKVILVRRLTALGYRDMVDRCMKGDYDQSLEEAEGWAEAFTGKPGATVQDAMQALERLAKEELRK